MSTEVELTINPGHILFISSVHPTFTGFTDDEYRRELISLHGIDHFKMDHVREERRETKVTIKVARVPVMCDHERDRVEDLYNDHLYDGLESGVKPGDARCDTDLSRPYFVPDTDQCVTDPFNDDTDGDDIKDGIEDVNHNGRIDGDNGDGKYQTNSEKWKETNPNDIDTDGDTINDNKEKEFKYNPLKQDTDGDGLTDIEEDKNKNGKYDPENEETNALELDTDKDGMQDKLELDGWIVCIRFGSTKEELTNYKVTSNPRITDTDEDKVLDFDEYKNTTDPNKADTDNDGRSDWMELNYNMSSTPTEIDGNPPDIKEFNSYYDVTYEKYLGVKLPNGIKLCINMRVSDMFGVYGVQVTIAGLGQQSVFTNNLTNVSVDFEWKVSGWDNIKKTIWEGFKINITAMDRNRNFGYKEEEQPGIAMIVLSALLGPLLSMVKFIMELVSGIFNWIMDAITNLFKTIVSKINDFLKFIFLFAVDLLNDIIESQRVNDQTILKDKIFELLKNPIVWIITGIEVIITIIDYLINAVPLAGQVKMIVGMIISVLILLFIASGGAEEFAKIFYSKFEGIVGDYLKIDFSDESSKSILGSISKVFSIASAVISTLSFVGVLLFGLIEAVSPTTALGWVSFIILNLISLALVAAAWGIIIYFWDSWSPMPIAWTAVIIAISAVLMIISGIQYFISVATKKISEFWVVFGGISLGINGYAIILAIISILTHPTLWELDRGIIDGDDDDGGTTYIEDFQPTNYVLSIILHSYQTTSPSSCYLGKSYPDPEIFDFNINNDLVKESHKLFSVDKVVMTEEVVIDNIGMAWSKKAPDIIPIHIGARDFDDETGTGLLEHAGQHEIDDTEPEPISIYGDKNSIQLYYDSINEVLFEDFNGNGKYDEETEHPDMNDYITHNGNYWIIHGDSGEYQGKIIFEIIDNT